MGSFISSLCSEEKSLISMAGDRVGVLGDDLDLEGERFWGGKVSET